MRIVISIQNRINGSPNNTHRVNGILSRNRYVPTSSGAFCKTSHIRSSLNQLVSGHHLQYVHVCLCDCANTYHSRYFRSGLNADTDYCSHYTPPGTAVLADTANPQELPIIVACTHPVPPFVYVLRVFQFPNLSFP